MLGKKHLIKDIAIVMPPCTVFEGLVAYDACAKLQAPNVNASTGNSSNAATILSALGKGICESLDPWHPLLNL